MSSQLRFEGNDLEGLLERVRSEVGNDARIVAANKLRKGGVGGFFARELFEVIVEPPVYDEEPLRPAARLGRSRRAPATTASGPTWSANPRETRSVVDLVDELDAHEEYEHSERNGATIDLGRAERMSEQPSVSTQTERFAQILERLAVTTDHSGAPATPPERSGPDPLRGGGYHNDDDGIHVVLDAITDAREPVEATFYSRSAAAKVATPLEDERFATQSANAPIGNAPIGNVQVGTAQQYKPQATPSHESHARYEREIAAVVAPTAYNDTDDLIERPERVLVKMGVPARYVPRGVSGTSMRGALVESFERLPQCETLPESRGVTVAIIGLGARPVALARILAAEQGIDPDTVVIATERELGNGVPPWLQITDGVSAQERRRSWRRRDHVSFVAISVPSITSGEEWTNEMLDHLEPTQVWAVANAGWKAEDVHAWTQRLGGIDVLAVERLDETVSPASLLEIGIPVSRIDGEPASPQRWADLLLDRVVVQ